MPALSDLNSAKTLLLNIENRFEPAGEPAFRETRNGASEFRSQATSCSMEEATHIRGPPHASKLLGKSKVLNGTSH